MLSNILVKTSYPAWFFILCLLAGLTYAGILYYKSRFSDEKSFFSFPNIFLAIFRFLVITLISYFLLSPFINKLFEKKEKPIIVVALDNSKSIVLAKDSVFYKSGFKKDIEKLVHSLSKKYEVQIYHFGNNLTKGIDYEYSGTRTNISGMLENVFEQNFNRNIGAFIIASDGIYNEGSDPIPATTGFRSIFYTIALGDTAIRKDILIKDINYNSIAYQGNTFPVRVKVAAKKFNQSKALIQLITNNKVIQEKKLEITSDNQLSTLDFNVEATDKGLQKYVIKVGYFNGEVNYTNNLRDIYVDVLESRKKVLIIALSPHPDVFAIKRSIEKNDNYRVVSGLASDYRKSEPELEKILSGYDMMFVHQLPGTGYPAKELFQAADKVKIPLFIIIGGQTTLGVLNNYNLGLSIYQKKLAFNNTLPEIAENFDYFSFSDNLKNILIDFPPLLSPFAEYKVTRENQVALLQKIGKIKTEFPLLIFINNVDYRVSFLCGEGIWRWPLTEYSLKQEQSSFDELINKSVQYLTVKSDKRFFRLKNLKTVFFEDEPIVFEAEALNQSYQKMQNAKISLQIIDRENKKTDFLFRETDNDYSLIAGYFSPGNYRFVASALLNGKDYKLTGEYTVRPVDIEYLNTVADHKLLYSIATNNMGKMFYPHQINDLIDILKKQKDIKPISHLDQDIRDLIEFRWIFGLILLLLTTEWFFRKYFGEY